MNLGFKVFINQGNLLLDRISVALLIQCDLRRYFFLDIYDLLKIELFKNLLSFFVTDASSPTKRLIFIEFKHYTMVPLILYLNTLNDSIDYVGCGDLHGLCGLLLLLLATTIGHPHLLVILRGKHLDPHVEIEELASVDVSRLEQPALDGQNVEVTQGLQVIAVVTGGGREHRV